MKSALSAGHNQNRALCCRADMRLVLFCFGALWLCSFNSAFSDEKTDRKNLAENLALIEDGNIARAMPSLRLLMNSRVADVAVQATYWVASASLEDKTGKADEAAKLLETVMMKATGELADRARVALARYRSKQGKISETVQLLDPMLASGSTTPFCIVGGELLGDVSVDAGNREQAKKAYTYALKAADYLKSYEDIKLPPEVDLERIRKKLAALDRKDKPEPDEPYATFQKAESERGRRKYTAAIDLYRKVISEHPDHELADASGYQIGNSLFEQNLMDAAQKHWELFIKANPKGPWRGQAMLGLGDIALERGLDPAKAEKLFEAVVNGGTSDKTWAGARPDALERYGICRFMSRDYDTAGKCFEEELLLRPSRTFHGATIPSQMMYLKELCEKKEFPMKHPDKVMTGSPKAQTALFLAAAYGECGSYDRAFEFLDMIISNRITDALPVHRAYAVYDKADDLKLTGKTAEAETLFRKCAKDFPLSPVAPLALLELANLQFADNRNSEADATLKEVWTKFASSPEAAKARYNYGWSLYFDEKWEASLVAFNDLVSRHSGSWEAGKAKELIIPDLLEKTGKEKR